MSLKLNERYPGRMNNPSADYPQGSFKNRTTPVAKDGSYLEQDWANDKEGFFQSLLAAVGATANGSVDKVGASQFFDSLIQTHQQQIGVAFTTTGTATAQVLTPTPAIPAYSVYQRFNVTFNTVSGANPTINVSGRGAKSLKQYDSTGAKVAAVFAANQNSDIVYDGNDFILLNVLPSKTDLLNTVRLDVASSAAINLTTAAPNTRNINITGSAGVTSFVVSAGQLYFVRFDATLTLTNSAGLVTNRGADIQTAAGDTCIIRATAANTVEILSYVKNPASRQALAASGWCKLDGDLIMQWGTRAATGTSTVTFPVSFKEACYSVTAVSGGSAGYPVISSLSSTSFSLAAVAPDTRWIAVGK